MDYKGKPWICQLAAVCVHNCFHRFPHKKDRHSHGCSKQGCKSAYVPDDSGLRDEFGQLFSHHNFSGVRIQCVKFAYWLKNTKHKQLIVTKGTFLEEFHKREQDRLREEAKKYEEWKKTYFGGEPIQERGPDGEA